jgi:hypothetical protein
VEVLAHRLRPDAHTKAPGLAGRRGGSTGQSGAIECTM